MNCICTYTIIRDYTSSTSFLHFKGSIFSVGFLLHRYEHSYIVIFNETNITRSCHIIFYFVSDFIGLYDLCSSRSVHMIITLLCLLFYFRKSIYKGTPNFIHFNLTLSLFIGLILFVSGVETAKDKEVSIIS